MVIPSRGENPFFEKGGVSELSAAGFNNVLLDEDPEGNNPEEGEGSQILEGLLRFISGKVLSMPPLDVVGGGGG